MKTKAKTTTTTLGSVRLMEEIRKRDISFQKAADELTAMGHATQRYSVWQWAHGISHPSLKNAFQLETWSRGRILAESWNAADEAEMKADQAERRSRRSR